LEEAILCECISVSSGEGLSKRKMKPGPYLVYGGNGFAGLHDNYLYEQEKLIIGRVGAHCGNVHITKSKSWVTDNALIVSFLNNEDDLRFWFYLLSNSNLRAHAFESAQPVITGGIISKIKVAIPTPTTQRQIATILSTADAVIEKTQAAIAKYKAIKQGMLQDLFTRGILTKDIKYKDKNGTWVERSRNQLRPSYQDAPELYKESKLGWIPKEWEVENFEGASELITDFTANGSFESLRLNVKYYYTIEYARLIRLTDLRVNLDNDGVYVDKEGFEFLSKSTLHENDIMLANVGEYTGFACLMPRVNYPATIAPNMFLIRCNKGIFNSLFMYYFMTLDVFTRQVDNVSASSATKLLNKTNFRALSILKPTISEQLKIGNFLKSIDSKLQTEQNFLHKQQQIKAGLMADLLSGRKKVSIKEEVK